MNLAIFAGEVSGDLIGGALARELRRLAPDASLWGLGSTAMREAGVELLADSASWGAISITEALRKVPRLLWEVQPKVKAALRERRPDVLVLIDFGAFNVRAARFAKSLGLKVCYYFPPGSWRRTGTKGADLAQVTDLVAVPFPWAAERLQGLGVNAVYVGHPILERVKPSLTKAEFAARFGIDPTRPLIGLLPGSRHHELLHLLPTLLDAARLLYQRLPDAQFVIGVAPHFSLELMERLLHLHSQPGNRLTEWIHELAQAEAKLRQQVSKTASGLQGKPEPLLVTTAGVTVPLREWEPTQRPASHSSHSEKRLPPVVLAQNLAYDVMAHSDLLLLCSGTATLEATLFETPMVILYRGSKIMEWEYKLRGLHKKLVHIGLPNILADRRIVPELIQEAATPEAITDHALALLNDLSSRAQMKRDLHAVHESLGEPGASLRTAHLILDLASHSPRPR